MFNYNITMILNYLNHRCFFLFTFLKRAAKMRLFFESGKHLKENN